MMGCLWCRLLLEAAAAGTGLALGCERGPFNVLIARGPDHMHGTDAGAAKPRLKGGQGVAGGLEVS